MHWPSAPCPATTCDPGRPPDHQGALETTPRHAAKPTTYVKQERCPAGLFFQAEDGIRDPLVTGVQTCALPISHPRVAKWAGCQSQNPALPGPLRSLVPSVDHLANHGLVWFETS